MALSTIKKAQQHGIMLYLDDGKLKAQAVKGAVTNDMKALISQHKDALIEVMGQLPLLNISDANITAMQTFWRKHLADTQAASYRPLTGLYASGSNCADSSLESQDRQRLSSPLCLDLVLRLDQLASELNCHRFALLQSVLVALLSRYSGMTDVVLGNHLQGGLNHCFAKRPLPLTTRAGERYDNALPLRLQWQPTLSLKALVADLEETHEGIMAHCALPQGLIQDALQQGDSSTSDLDGYDITAAYYDDGAELQTIASDINLALECKEQGGTLSLDWCYNPEKLTPEQMQGLAQNYITLLTEALIQPDAALNSLKVVSAYEQQQLAQWRVSRQYSEGDARYQQYSSIQARFAKWVQQVPDNIAVWDDQQSLTYGHLAERSDQLASYLLQQGIQAEDVIAICQPRSVEVFVSMLAVLKAGAAYLPIDPNAPAQRIEYMLQTSEAKLILTHGSADSSAFACPVLDLAALDLAEVEVEPLPQVQPTQLAYAIFTSGSTGKPKCSVLQHQSALNLAFNQQDGFAPKPGSRVIQFASIGFDAATWEWLMALLSGASLYICSEDTRQSALLVGAFLRQHHITHATLPPALLTHIPLDQPYALQALVVAGEAITEELAWNWAEHYNLINAYGPSETTVCATMGKVTPQQPVTIGTPLSNVEVYVLQPNSTQLAPIGVEGELAVGGVALARHYLNNPEATAKAFVTLNLEGQEQRVYRTGDRVCYTPEGNLAFVGRIDNQIQLNGYRVELGEIEQQLKSHPAVQDSFVMVDAGDKAASANSKDNKRLLAYVVADDGGATDAAESRSLSQQLLEQAQSQLPAYMVPAAIMVLDRFPLNLNGKIDKDKLPAADFRQLSGLSYVAPQTELQRLMCEQWQQLLPVDKVGITDSFFALGGDSILSMQAVALANQAGIAIAVTDIITHQSIEVICEHVDSSQIAQPKVDEVAEGAIQLLPVQAQYLRNTVVDPEHFNQSLLLEVPDDLSLARLKQALQAIVARHDTLRLGFSSQLGANSAFDSYVGKYQSFAPDQIDAAVSQISLPRDEAAHAAFIQAQGEQLQTGFNLNGELLFKALLLSSEQQSYLLLVAHHLVIDGISWRILLQDLTTAYQALKAEQAVNLGPKTASYQQWGEALYSDAHLSYLSQQLPYWQVVEQASCKEITPDFPEQTGCANQAHSQTCGLELDEHLTQQLLTEANRAYNTKVNDLLLAAVLEALRQWQGIDAVNLLMESHGRDANPGTGAVDLSQTLGWFTATYPLHLQHPSSDLSDLIKAVKEQAHSVPDNGLGYAVLRQTQGQELNSVSTPVLFNYLGQFDQSLGADSGFAFSDINTGATLSPKHQRPSLLGINGLVSQGKLSLVVDYSALQFKPQSIAALRDALQSSLQQIVQHCLQAQRCWTPSDFPTAAVSQEQLDTWQKSYDIAAIYPATPMQQGLLFHSMLDHQAYLSQTYFTFKGAIDLHYLQQAWQRTWQQFPALRTVFVGEQTQFQQLVVAQVELPWTLLDWRNRTPEDAEQAFDNVVAQDRGTGFALDRAPLSRITVVKLADERTKVLWTHHHALLDGWSLPRIFAAIMAHYNAVASGDSAPQLGSSLNSPLKPTTRDDRYLAYSQWLQGQDSVATEAFWQAALADVEAPNQIPNDRQLCKANAPVSQFVDVTLTQQQTQALKTLAQSCGVTAYTLLQMAWGFVLHKYTGDNSVVFGAITSGRTPQVPGIEDLVGLFINTVPVRLNFADKKPLTELLQDIQMRFQSCADHGYVGLHKIQKHSAIPAGTNMFESLLVLENYPLDAAFAAETEVDFALEDVGASEQTNYQLTLNAHLTDVLALRCRFNSHEFLPDTVTRMLQHLSQCLVQLPEQPQYWDISLLTAAEKQQLALWNQTPQYQQQHLCIHQQFEAQAARFANNIALVCEQQTLTYAQLNDRANRLARLLIAQGAMQKQGEQGDNPLVGLYLSRSVDMVVGLLAILKAGAAYVPLDPGAPVSRLNFIVQDSGMALLLTDGELEPIAASRDCGHIDMSNVPNLMDFSGDNLSTSEALVQDADVAYVIYTSGSTGKPKGVLVEHRNVMRLFDACNQTFQFSENDCWTLFHSIAFDFSVWEMWGALFHGGKLVIVPKDIARSTDSFYELVVQQQVTVLSQTPASFEQFSRIDEMQQSPLALRYVVFGGAALDLASLTSWSERHSVSDLQLINMYGITETTVHVTFKGIAQQDIAASRGSLIGMPLAHLSGYVLDQYQQQVPLGIVGELFVGGGGVTRGYLHRPELTKTRFVPSPFVEGERLYRTGDLVKRLSNGELEYVGRIDDQVKIRGFRIELSEIEYELTALDSVREAVVVTHGDGNNMQLVAYVVASVSSDAETASVVSAEQIKTALRAQLPDYMVPASIVLLPRFPITVNGKIDKKALPEPVFQQSENAFVAPETETQKHMAAVWCDVLALQQVGIHDNFFSVGGDSIRAITLVGQLKQAGFAVAVKDVLAKPTIAQLCADEGEMRQPVSDAEVAAIAPFSLIEDAQYQRLLQEQAALGQQREIADVYPMTRLQQGMVYHNLTSQGHSAYHDVMSFRLAARWDQGRFNAALQSVVQRHEILRTLFYFNDQNALQIVLQQCDAEAQVEDLRGLSPEQQNETLQHWIEQEKATDFPQHLPGWRVFVHLRNEEEFQYTLSFHHALMDGWSVASFNTELFNAYTASEKAALPTPLPFNYYVQQELETLKDQQNYDYWRDKLAGVQLPWWSGKQASASVVSTGTINTEKTEKISQLAKQLGVQERSVMLAVHTVLMSLLCGKSDVVTSVVVNARPELTNSELTLGLFLNTLPFRANVADCDWLTLIRQVQQHATQDSSARALPLHEIQQLSGLEFSSAMFNYVSFHVYQQLSESIEVLEATGAEETNFALSVNVSKSLGESPCFELSITADSGIFAGAQRMIGYFESIVDAMLLDTSAKVTAGQHLSAAEQACYAPVALPSAVLPSNAATALFQPLVQQAKDQPDAIALRFESQKKQLSYAQLNNQVNYLCQQLMAAGVGAETPVAVYMPRSPALIIALLAIQKAGGYYIPLDVDYPMERTEAVLESAQPQWVLTDDSEAGVLSASYQQLSFPREMRDYSASETYPEPQNPVTAEQLAYAIFTSGSTGVPKGIAISHGNAMSMVQWALTEYQPSQLEQVLMATSICFDLSVYELFVTLSSGGCVVLVNNALALMDAPSPETVDNENSASASWDISLINTVPSAIDALQRAGKIPTSVKTINLAGEPLTRALVDRLYQLPHIEKVYNLYGPSEDTTYSTYALVPKDSAAKPMIGRPLSGTAAYVLGDRQQLLPPGVPGELYLAGTGVTRGYLNQPELTAKAFLPNPFHPDSCPRMYRTGDQVVMHPDGMLEYLGREDAQIKIRGFRVELGDIEHALTDMAMIKQAAVLVKHKEGSQGIAGQEVLVAYCTLDVTPAEQPQLQDLVAVLRSHMASRLPSHMQPARYEVLADMPLMPNGKIDRKALPEPELGMDATFVAPQTPLETDIAAIWADLLALPAAEVGSQNSFFEQGGNSLSATRLLTAINGQYQLQLTLLQIFEHPTVAAQASLVEAEQSRLENAKLLESSEDMMEMEW